MGCGGSQMVAVAPATDSISPKRLYDTVQSNFPSKRIGSAVSKSSKDSGVEEDVKSDITSLRTQSGVSRKTLASLKPSSARVRPVESESDILKNLRAEGFITTETHKARSGVSFDVVEDNRTKNIPRRLPARLAKLDKKKKKVKLITQQDIENKLEKAEQRRKEVEAERLNKIHSLIVKSDIPTALDAFAEKQKDVEENSARKVDMAAEHRAKKLRELRAKLRAKEEHAAKVRERKLLAKAQEDTENVEPETTKLDTK